MLFVFLLKRNKKYASEANSDRVTPAAAAEGARAGLIALKISAPAVPATAFTACEINSPAALAAYFLLPLSHPLSTDEYAENITDGASIRYKGAISAAPCALAIAGAATNDTAAASAAAIAETAARKRTVELPTGFCEDLPADTFAETQDVIPPDERDISSPYKGNAAW